MKLTFKEKISFLKHIIVKIFFEYIFFFLVLYAFVSFVVWLNEGSNYCDNDEHETIYYR